MAPKATSPSELLAAVSSLDGGKIALVLGAGCSFASPTEIPLAKRCAQHAYHELQQDGLILDGECESPEDLSALADVVHAKTGMQAPLVSRLPVTVSDLQLAAANTGYYTAAALLAERAISTILTLNYDLAIANAISELRLSKCGISIINGPEDHAKISTTNVIFLHRSAYADVESWIIRTVDLREKWKDSWEEVIAKRVISSPHIVFAGLGSAAAVLTETVSWLQSAVEKGPAYYQVDPSPYGESEFATVLKVPETRYIQSGWNEFMQTLAHRLVLAQLDRVRAHIGTLTQLNGWSEEDVSDEFAHVEHEGLLGLGKLRATWLLDSKRYLPAVRTDESFLADLFHGFAFLSRVTECALEFSVDTGLVWLLRENRRIAVIIAATGRGTLGRAAVEPKLGSMTAALESSGFAVPAMRVLFGVSDYHVPLSPPLDILGDDDPDDVSRGGTVEYTFSMSELRVDPAPLIKLVANG